MKKERNTKNKGNNTKKKERKNKGMKKTKYLS